MAALFFPAAPRGSAARLLLASALVAEALAFAPHSLASHPARDVPARATGPVAAAVSPNDYKGLRDVLMSRTVETQVQAFAMMHERALQIWLNDKWTGFSENKKHAGRLTEFFNVLVSSTEVESVFVPRVSFRQLSPGNPYMKKRVDGDEMFINPQKEALRLVGTREQLGDLWLAELERLSFFGVHASEEENENATSVLDSDSLVRASDGCSVDPLQVLDNAGADECITPRGDKQLLHSLALKKAVREMLNDLSLRPSTSHLHEWLSTFLFVKHARDLSREGSVQDLLADLEAQPLHIRGGCIVDPLQIDKDIKRRTAVITTDMGESLQTHLPDAGVVVRSSFLEGCLGLPDL